MSDAGANIALFGGSGATGQEVVASAVERGWRVSGLVRHQGSLAPAIPGVREVVATFESSEGVRRTLTGADAIIITIGPRPPSQEVFCAAATRLIADVARDVGVTRLVCLTGALIGDYRENQGTVFRLLGRLFRGKAEASWRDRIAQEDAVRQSGLRWTLVKPPRLTHGPRTGRVKIGPEVRTGLLSAISRKDLADVLLNLCADENAVGGTLFVNGA